MSSRVIEKLFILLDAERDQLLAGQLEAVGAFAPEKEALVASLGVLRAEDLTLLSRKLDRNKALLAAARDGVTTVLETLRAQKRARSTLSTYDRSGRPATIARTSGSTERRF